MFGNTAFNVGEGVYVREILPLMLEKVCVLGNTAFDVGGVCVGEYYF